MIVKKENLVEKVQKSYQQLSTISAELNAASDKLGVSVSALDTSLRKLNLGISSWTHFSEWRSGDRFQYTYEDIGYTKIGGKWTLAIRTVSGNEAEGDNDGDTWPFNEAPRGLRVKAILKVAELLEQLFKDAMGMVKTIHERVEVVDFLNAGIEDAISEIETSRASAVSLSSQITTSVGQMMKEAGRSGKEIALGVPTPASGRTAK